MRRSAGLVQWLNQGLHDGDCAIVSAGVAPGFQVVGFGDVPQTMFGCFVPIQTQIDAEGDIGELLGERNIGRGVEGGIATEDDERFHLPRRHVVGQFLQRSHLIYGIRFDRFCVNHGGADIAQGFVHGVRQSVYCRGLLITGDDHTFAAVLHQILGYCIQPLVVSPSISSPRRNAQLVG